MILLPTIIVLIRTCLGLTFDISLRNSESNINTSTLLSQLNSFNTVSSTGNSTTPTLSGSFGNDLNFVLGNGTIKISSTSIVELDGAPSNSMPLNNSFTDDTNIGNSDATSSYSLTSTLKPDQLDISFSSLSKTTALPSSNDSMYLVENRDIMTAYQRIQSTSDTPSKTTSFQSFNNTMYSKGVNEVRTNFSTSTKLNLSSISSRYSNSSDTSSRIVLASTLSVVFAVLIVLGGIALFRGKFSFFNRNIDSRTETNPYASARSVVYRMP